MSETGPCIECGASTPVAFGEGWTICSECAGETDRSVLEDAIETYGEEAQLELAGEEVTELDLALHRYDRGRATESDVIDEIADVIVMTRQLKLIFGEDRVNREVNRKMNRLERRLEDET